MPPGSCSFRAGKPAWLVHRSGAAGVSEAPRRHDITGTALFSAGTPASSSAVAASLAVAVSRPVRRQLGPSPTSWTTGASG